MKNRVIGTIIGLIALSLVVAFYLYPLLPDRIAGHWNAQGEVDDYDSKLFGLLAMPVLLLIMLGLYLFLPHIDPLKENIEKFRKYFDNLIILLAFFVFFLYAITLIWNLGYQFDMGQALILPLAVIFYYSGVVIAHAQRNWSIGIRTPWTLTSDFVWEKTHKLGSRLFKISAGFCLFGFFIPAPGNFWIVILPIGLSAVFLFLYSYWLFRQEKQKPGH